MPIMHAQAGHLEMARRAAAGDALSLKLLLADLHGPLSESIQRRIPPDLRSLIAADDVLQEAYVQVFRHIARFEPRDEESFQHWLTTIAHNRLRNAVRAQRTCKRGGGAAAQHAIPPALEQSYLSLLDLAAGPGRTPSRSVARGEAAAAVQMAIDSLPEQYRQALWLVYVDGQTAASAGRHMNRSERAIHGLCRRGLALLRERLGSADRLLSFRG